MPGRYEPAAPGGERFPDFTDILAVDAAATDRSIRAMASRTAPILDVHDLQVRRGAAHLLAGVTWRIRPGEHWVVLGANGSGKTSLLRVLMGFLSPTSGSLTLLGARFGAADWREVRPRIGLVSSALHVHIPPAETALETVISGRYAQLDFWGQATPADVRAARACLRALGAVALADRPWAWLSQGERQRVLIARALVARPGLLILDEPCAGLDPVARADILATVNAIAGTRSAPTLIFVTHHVEEITPRFTHVLLLAQGRVTAAGPRADVLTSANLSAAYGRPVRLQRSPAGWRLVIR